MKRKILSVLLTLVLVLSFSLVTAVPVAADATTYEALFTSYDNISDGRFTMPDGYADIYNGVLSSGGIDGAYDFGLSSGPDYTGWSADHTGEGDYGDPSLGWFYEEKNGGWTDAYSSTEDTDSGYVEFEWTFDNVAVAQGYMLTVTVCDLDDYVAKKGEDWASVPDEWGVYVNGSYIGDLYAYDDTGSPDDPERSINVFNVGDVSGSVKIEINGAYFDLLHDEAYYGTNYGGYASWGDTASAQHGIRLEGLRLAPVVNADTGEGFSSIQAAITAAGSGDTINVAAGTYVEDLVIPDTKTDLELVGAEGAVIKGVAMVDSEAWPSHDPNIDIRAVGVSIHGFTIQGPDPDPGYYSSGMIIGGADVEIYGNAFEVGNASNTDDLGQAIVAYNQIAIPDVDVSGLSIHNNTFTSHGAGTTGYEGIYINRDVGIGAVTIADNTFTGDMIRGITVERSNATISGNSLVATGGEAWTGVLVMDIGSGEAQDSISIIGNTIDGFSNGIKLGDSGGTQVLTNISITDNTLEGNDVGILVRSSAGGVVVNNNNISGNTTYGLQNTDTNILDATENWWGDASGPFHSTNSGGLGNAVSDNVHYSTWCAIEDTDLVTPGYQAPTLMVWGVSTDGTIQGGIDAADPGDTVNVAEGIYDEQVVIGDSLTLQGAGDTTVIQPSAATVLTTVKTVPWLGTATREMAAIVFVDAATTVVVKDLKIDGSLITEVPAGVGSDDWVAGLAYLETGGTIDSLAVVGNPLIECRNAGIWASAISTTSSVEVKGCNVIGYNRAGIYAVGVTMTANYHHNEINGPGAHAAQVPNGIFFCRGATGSATYNTVTDLGYTGEQYRSTGIGTYNAGTPITFAYNIISKVQNAFALSKGSSGTIVEYNTVYDCHTGVRIETGAHDNTIQYNSIEGNTYAIRCGAGTTPFGEGNVANYNNFVNNPGDPESVNYVGAVSIHPEATHTLNAKYNWWGRIGGPGGEGLGNGDSVSANVLYDPWLTEDYDTTIDDGIAYFGSTISLEPGWNTLSVPLKLKDNADSAKSANTIAEIVALGDFITNENVQIVYRYDPGSPAPWQDIGASDTAVLAPGRGYYIKILGTDTVDFPVLYSGTLGLPTLQLSAGWNLIGSGFGINKTDYGIAATNDEVDGRKDVATALYSIRDKCSVVVSPSTQGQVAAWGTTVIDETKFMIVGEAYWVFMMAPATLAGFEVTPIYYLP